MEHSKLRVAFKPMNFIKKPFALILLTIIGCTQRSFTQEQAFPYKLKLSTEIPILASVLGVSLINTYGLEEPMPLTDAQLSLFNPTQINRFDRFAITKASYSAEKASDVFRDVLFIAPAALGLKPLINKEWQQVVTLSAIYIETIYVNRTLTTLTKNTFQRKRPYLYNQSLSSDEKKELFDKGSPQKSFVSGHTSMAFCSAVFLSTVYTNLYGKSGYSTLIWVSSLSAATLVGYLRIEAGMHFPSDVLAGAVLGSLVGYTIPRIHRINNNKVSLTLTGNFAQLTLRF